MAETKTTFPTKADKDGFFFETTEEKDMGVTTKIYDNGRKTKNMVLKDGRKAVLFQLKGRDMLNIKRWIQNDPNVDIETATLAQACKVAGETYPPDYYLDLDLPDYSGLVATNTLLNFQ